MSRHNPDLWRKKINFDGINKLVLAPALGRCNRCPAKLSSGHIFCGDCCERKRDSSRCQVYGCDQKGTIIAGVGFVFDFCRYHSEEGLSNLILLVQHRQDQIIRLQEEHESEAIRNKDQKRPRDDNSEEILALKKKVAVQAFQLEALENDRHNLIQEVVGVRTRLTFMLSYPQPPVMEEEAITEPSVMEEKAVTKPTLKSGFPVPNFL